MQMFQCIHISVRSGEKKPNKEEYFRVIEKFQFSLLALIKLLIFMKLSEAQNAEEHQSKHY